MAWEIVTAIAKQKRAEGYHHQNPRLRAARGVVPHRLRRPMQIRGALDAQRESAAVTS